MEKQLQALAQMRWPRTKPFRVADVQKRLKLDYESVLALMKEAEQAGRVRCDPNEPWHYFFVSKA